MVVCGVWCVVCGMWCVVCGLWFVVCDLVRSSSAFCRLLRGLRNTLSTANLPQTSAKHIVCILYKYVGLSYGTKHILVSTPRLVFRKIHLLKEPKERGEVREREREQSHIHTHTHTHIHTLTYTHTHSHTHTHIHIHIHTHTYIAVMDKISSVHPIAPLSIN